MPKLFGLEFAPIFIPLKRRLQTLSVLLYVSCCVIFPFLFTGGLIVTLFTDYYWLSLGYSLWWFYDHCIRQSSVYGGRTIKWLRNAPHHRYFRDYFPMELVKTSDLDPKKNYIGGLHPHGIISCSMFLNFATEATGFSEKFPGIASHLLTLKANCMWPILRGYVLMMGGRDVTKETIEQILTNEGVGNAVMIVVGGAEEALEAHPGTYRIAIKKRKGFVRLAIKHGADLLPIYSFGENDLYNQVPNPEGSFVRQFQNLFKQMTGFSPPIFHGRGVFNYTFGLLPYRKRVRTVVGKPLNVPHNPSVPPALVDEIHGQYLKALSNLFDEHKGDFGISKDKKMEFV